MKNGDITWELLYLLQHSRVVYALRGATIDRGCAVVRCFRSESFGCIFTRGSSRVQVHALSISTLKTWCIPSYGISSSMKGFSFSSMTLVYGVCIILEGLSLWCRPLNHSLRYSRSSSMKAFSSSSRTLGYGVWIILEGLSLWCRPLNHSFKAHALLPNFN